MIHAEIDRWRPLGSSDGQIRLPGYMVAFMRKPCQSSLLSSHEAGFSLMHQHGTELLYAAPTPLLTVLRDWVM